MAMVGSWVLVLFWMVPVVRGEYNCSKSRIPESQMADFKENLKRCASTLNLNLYLEHDKKLNLSSTSDKMNHTVGMWGECDVSGTSDDCRDCVNQLTATLLTVCNSSSWGELAMVVKGKNVCFVHYNAVDYVNIAASATLIQKFRQSFLFFMLWHMLIFLYMCFT